MGKHHQASRRKAYGRRQHEIRQRFDRPSDLDAEPATDAGHEVPGYERRARDRFDGFDLQVAAGMHLALGD